MSATIVCQMQLSSFPMDRQVCTLSLYSFGFYADELWLFWDTYPNIFYEHSIDTLTSFFLEHYATSVDNIAYCTSSNNASAEPECRTKNFLTMEFEFKRYFLSVFFISYLPATIMVLLGGLATYIDPKSSPARVGMGITTVLTISTVIQGLKSQLPAVNYLTALDVYLWACFFFVSVTLIEYAYLNYQTVVLPRYKNEENMTFEDLEEEIELQTSRKGQKEEEAENTFSESQKLLNSGKKSMLNIPKLSDVYTQPDKTIEQSDFDSSQNTYDWDSEDDLTKITRAAIEHWRSKVHKNNNSIGGNYRQRANRLRTSSLGRYETQNFDFLGHSINSRNNLTRANNNKVHPIKQRPKTLKMQKYNLKSSSSNLSFPNNECRTIDGVPTSKSSRIINSSGHRKVVKNFSGESENLENSTASGNSHTGVSPKSSDALILKNNSNSQCSTSRNVVKKVIVWNRKQKNYSRTLEIDRNFRLGYSFSFVVFNLIYWTYYLRTSRHK